MASVKEENVTMVKKMDVPLMLWNSSPGIDVSSQV
jgi:hypothetical protein